MTDEDAGGAALAAAEAAPLEERAARYLALHADLLAALSVSPAE